MSKWFLKLVLVPQCYYVHKINHLRYVYIPPNSSWSRWVALLLQINVKFPSTD